MDINRLSVAVAVLFAIFIINGWRKGFLKIIISFAGTIVILIAVAVLSPKVSRYVTDNTGIYEKTRQTVISVFLERLSQADDEEQNANDALDTGDGSPLDDLDLPDIMKHDFIEKNASEMYQALLTAVFRDYISVYITKLIINAGSFVGVYLALSLILFIIVRTSDLISKIPVIKGVNKLLGCLTGAAEALILAWVFFFIIIMFLGNSIGGRLLKDVQESGFLSYLFNNNYLFRFIS